MMWTIIWYDCNQCGNPCDTTEMLAEARIQRVSFCCLATVTESTRSGRTQEATAMPATEAMPLVVPLEWAFLKVSRLRFEVDEHKRLQLVLYVD